MNSVLQQLFCTPAIYEQILSVNLDSVDEETIFFQLQNVFGHLSESKLQFYEPEKFWKCFRLFGQPVNVREQQDAFEFFTQIVDQVDEFLSKNKKPKVFASRCVSKMIQIFLLFCKPVLKLVLTLRFFFQV